MDDKIIGDDIIRWDEGIEESIEEVQDVADDNITCNASNAKNSKNILVISSRVNDPATLVAAAKDNVEVIFYDWESTSLAELLVQMRSVAKEYNIDNIAFATHGDEGGFSINSENRIDDSSLFSNDSQKLFWKSVGNLIDKDGRIDLLGCNIANSSAGKSMISQLESLTQRNFAASTDITGNALAGGNWILETDNVDIKNKYFIGDEIDKWQETLLDVQYLDPPLVINPENVSSRLSYTGTTKNLGDGSWQLTSTNFEDYGTLSITTDKLLGDGAGSLKALDLQFNINMQSNENSVQGSSLAFSIYNDEASEANEKLSLIFDENGISLETLNGAGTLTGDIENENPSLFRTGEDVSVRLQIVPIENSNDATVIVSIGEEENVLNGVIHNYNLPTEPIYSFIGENPFGECLIDSAQDSSVLNDSIIFPALSFGGFENSARIDGDIIKITDAINSQRGFAMVDLPSLVATGGMQGFNIEFDVLIGGGTQADGLSINFGDAEDIPRAQGEDNTPAYEEGTNQGFAISIDTYDNGGNDYAGISLKFNGEVMKKTDGSDAYSGLGSIRTNNWVHISLEANSTDTTKNPPDIEVKMKVGDYVVLDNARIYDWLTNENYKYWFGARTGDSNDNHWIKNLVIYEKPDSGAYQQSVSDIQLTQNTLETAHAPIVIPNSPVTITTDERYKMLNISDFIISDPDDIDNGNPIPLPDGSGYRFLGEEFTFIVEEVSAGSLQLLSSSGIWETLANGDTFTNEDLENGRVKYVPDYSNLENSYTPFNGNFKFYLQESADAAISPLVKSNLTSFDFIIEPPKTPAPNLDFPIVKSHESLGLLLSDFVDTSSDSTEEYVIKLDTDNLQGGYLEIFNGTHWEKLYGEITFDDKDLARTDRSLSNVRFVATASEISSSTFIENASQIIENSLPFKIWYADDYENSPVVYAESSLQIHVVESPDIDFTFPQESFPQDLSVGTMGDGSSIKHQVTSDMLSTTSDNFDASDIVYDVQTFPGWTIYKKRALDSSIDIYDIVETFSQEDIDNGYIYIECSTPLYSEELDELLLPNVKDAFTFVNKFLDDTMSFPREFKVTISEDETDPPITTNLLPKFYTTSFYGYIYSIASHIGDELAINKKKEALTLLLGLWEDYLSSTAEKNRVENKDIIVNEYIGTRLSGIKEKFGQIMDIVDENSTVADSAFEALLQLYRNPFLDDLSNETNRFYYYYPNEKPGVEYNYDHVKDAIEDAIRSLADDLLSTESIEIIKHPAILMKAQEFAMENIGIVDSQMRTMYSSLQQIESIQEMLNEFTGMISEDVVFAYNPHEDDYYIPLVSNTSCENDVDALGNSTSYNGSLARFFVQQASELVDSDDKNYEFLRLLFGIKDSVIAEKTKDPSVDHSYFIENAYYTIGNVINGNKESKLTAGEMSSFQVNFSADLSKSFSFNFGNATSLTESNESRSKSGLSFWFDKEEGLSLFYNDEIVKASYESLESYKYPEIASIEDGNVEILFQKINGKEHYIQVSVDDNVIFETKIEEFFSGNSWQYASGIIPGDDSSVLENLSITEFNPYRTDADIDDEELTLLNFENDYSRSRIKTKINDLENVLNNFYTDDSNLKDILNDIQCKLKTFDFWYSDNDCNTKLSESVKNMLTLDKAFLKTRNYFPSTSTANDKYQSESSFPVLNDENNPTDFNGNIEGFKLFGELPEEEREIAIEQYTLIHRFIEHFYSQINSGETSLYKEDSGIKYSVTMEGSLTDLYFDGEVVDKIDIGNITMAKNINSGETAQFVIGDDFSQIYQGICVDSVSEGDSAISLNVDIANGSISSGDSIKIVEPDFLNVSSKIKGGIISNNVDDTFTISNIDLGNREIDEGEKFFFMIEGDISKVYEATSISHIDSESSSGEFYVSPNKTLPTLPANIIATFPKTLRDFENLLFNGLSYSSASNETMQQNIKKSMFLYQQITDLFQGLFRKTKSMFKSLAQKIR